MPCNAIRGLSLFIADIRACSTRGQEEHRVAKELAKLRQRSTKLANGYEKKKCVWKLVYIALLGYNIPFGHMEAINLLGSQVHSEKLCGYIASSILLKDEPLHLGLATNITSLDILNYAHSPSFACLALNFVANAATADMAPQLYQAVSTAITNVDTPVHVRQKAFVAALRLARVVPDMMPPVQWCDKLVILLARESSSLVLNAILTLMLGLMELSQGSGCAAGHLTASQQPPSPVWEPLFEPCVLLFHRLSSEGLRRDLRHAGIAAPWLRLKLLRIFQHFHPKRLPVRLTEHLAAIASAVPSVPRAVEGDMTVLPAPPPPSKSSRRGKHVQEQVSRACLEHAILFEVVRLINAWRGLLPPELRLSALAALSAGGGTKVANLRYIRLQCQTLLLTKAGSRSTTARLTEGKDALGLEGTAGGGEQLESVLCQLLDSDPALQTQAVQLLAVLTPAHAWTRVVQRLLACAAAVNPNVHRQLADTVCQLTEKYSSGDAAAHLRVVFDLLDVLPAAVSEPAKARLVARLQKADAPAVQAEAARKAFDTLADPYCDADIASLAAYLLGEFGSLIVHEAPPAMQIALLEKCLHRAVAVRSALVALAKCGAQCGLASPLELEKVEGAICKFLSHPDTELQTRAAELINLLALGSRLSCQVLFPQKNYSSPRDLLSEKSDERPGYLNRQRAERRNSSSSNSSNCSSSRSSSGASSDRSSTSLHVTESAIKNKLERSTVEAAMWRVEAKLRPRDYAKWGTEKQVAVTVYNRSRTSDLHLMSASLSPSTCLRMDIVPDSAEEAARPLPPCVIRPAESTKFDVTAVLQSLTGFVPPNLELHFLVDGGLMQRQLLQLPLLPTSFVEEGNLTLDHFEKFWTSPRVSECQSSFELPRPHLSARSVGAILAKAAHMKVDYVISIDRGPVIRASAKTWLSPSLPLSLPPPFANKSAPTSPGTLVWILVEVGFDENDEAQRVDLRVSDKAVTRSVQASLRTLLD